MKRLNLFLSGLSLIALVASCAQSERVEDKIPTPKSIDENTYPEINLLNNNYKFKKFAEACISTEPIRSTSYGVWYSAKECSLPISRSPQRFIKINSFHRNTKGDIDGLQGISVKAKTLSILRRKYAAGTHTYGGACVKLGQNTLPLLILTKANLCDALAYDLI